MHLSGLLSCTNCVTWPVGKGEAINGCLTGSLFVILRNLVYFHILAIDREAT